MKRVISLLLCVAIAFAVCGCGGKTYDGEKIARLNSASAERFSADAAQNADYISAYDKFSFDFFNTVIKAEQDKNVCLSPFSAYMAFSLCFAGSDGNTAEEFKTVFGLQKEKAAEFCQGLYGNFVHREYYSKNTKVNLANSVWIDNDYTPFVKDGYLKTATEYFNAAIFKCDFSDKATVKAVNDWCKDNTDGLIDKIVDGFDEHQFMALINALLIEAEWAETYDSYSVVKDDFTDKNGAKKQAEFLSRRISSYYSATDAQAFKMPLKDGFSFVGILPNESVDIDAYCNTLTADKISVLLNKANYDCFVNTRIPKFKNDYEIDLVEIMQTMGINDAFDGVLANFKPMVEIPNSNAYIGAALQKTHFELDEKGIKAAAVTYIGMKDAAMMPEQKPTINIYLDRPFVYILMDEASDLPMFIGTVKTI